MTDGDKKRKFLFFQPLQPNFIMHILHTVLNISCGTD